MSVGIAKRSLGIGSAITLTVLALLTAPASAVAAPNHGGGYHGGYGYHGGGGGGFRGGWHGRGWGGVGFYFGGYPYAWGWPGYYAPAYYYPAYGYAAYPAAYYAPPPVVAAPAQAAQAPEAQRAYDVFFDFDKADITPTAAKVIAEAASNAKSSGVTRINVTGHTDTTGTSGYNQSLSDRRAAAVRRQLVADGVPAAEIGTNGLGKTDPLVPTGDQVREPRNRRVQIMLGDGNVASASRPAQVATNNCRDFQRMIAVDGQTHMASGTACQQGDGSWRVVR